LAEPTCKAPVEPVGASDEARFWKEAGERLPFIEPVNCCISEEGMDFVKDPSKSCAGLADSPPVAGVVIIFNAESGSI
jgi:hypothetical protein